MAAGQFQREGTVKFGTAPGSLTVDSADVTKCRISRTYDAIQRKGTFADSRNTTWPGNYTDEMELMFYSSGTSSQTTLDGLISEAVFGATPSTVLYFEFLQSNDAVGATNQRFTGTVSIMEAAKGGEVGTIRQESMTLPILTLVRANV